MSMKEKLNLPPNKIHGSTREREKMFLELYNQGLNDREIAEQLNLANIDNMRMEEKTQFGVPST